MGELSLKGRVCVVGSALKGVPDSRTLRLLPDSSEFLSLRPEIRPFWRRIPLVSMFNFRNFGWLINSIQTRMGDWRA